MDINKFNTLAEMVREARFEDARLTKIAMQATEEMKAANKMLTERLAMLNGYVAQQVNEATSREGDVNVR